MKTGYAYLTTLTQQFLDSCDAVIEWHELDDDIVVFRYDDSIEVHDPRSSQVEWDCDSLEEFELR